jgi:hypothetical protein
MHVPLVELKNYLNLLHLSTHVLVLGLRFISDVQERQTLVPFLGPCLQVRQLLGQD